MNNEMIAKQNNSIFVFLESVFLSSVIFASGSLFNIAHSTIVSIILMCSTLLLLLLYGIDHSSIKALGIFLIISSFVIIQCLVFDTNSLLPNIKNLVKFLLVILGVNVIIKKDQFFLEKIVKILFFFCVLSFIVYALLFFNISIPEFALPNMNFQASLYLNVKNTAIGLAGSGITIPRNFGIFWEPGLYQIFLNFLLIYFLNIKKSFIKSVFVIINVVLTFSITGFITTILIVTAFLFFGKIKTGKKIIFLAIALITLIGAYPFYQNFFVFKQTTGSYDWRMQDIFLGIKTFFAHPLFGIGSSGQMYIDAFYSENGVMHANTNGLIRILMCFGILGGIYYFTSFYYSYKYVRLKYNGCIAISFIGWLICSLINEPIETQPFVFLVISCGMYCFFSRKQASSLNNKLILEV